MSYKTFIDKCYLFNELAGKGKFLEPTDITKQSLLIKEEANELYEAVLKYTISLHRPTITQT